MSAKATTAAPTGRKRLAQGKERSDGRPGNKSQNTSSPEGAKECGMVALGELSEGRVSQDGPPSRGEFTYVDISSIDREAKRIVDPKVLPVAKAPSRAKQVLKAGDVVVSMTRPNLNAVALVPTDLDGAIGSTGFHVLRAKDAEPGFLFYAVQATSFIDAMCLKVQGALYPAVRPKDISSFCLPSFPLVQQRRIVAEIEKQFTRLEAGVAALRRVQANLKRYRAAVLKAACEGQLVENEVRSKKAEGRSVETGEHLLKRILAERRRNWEELNQKSKIGNRKYREPAAPDTANLPPLPEGWTWATLDQLHIYLRNGWGLKPDAETGTPILRISANRPMSVNLDDVRFLSGSPDDFAEYLVTEGDLLFTRYNGNPNLTGVCGVVPPLDAKIVHPDKLIRVLLVPKLCLSKFVGMVANVGVSRDFLASRARTTAGQTGISGSDLRGIPVPLPPLVEQTRIVAEVERRLSVVEELESVVSANLQRATRLRHSVLQKAFT